MSREAQDIIRRPILTEKLTELRETQRKIGLLVRSDANKVEIKKAAEQDLLRRAAGNLQHLMVLGPESINVRDLLLHEKLLIARRDLVRLQEIWI